MQMDANRALENAISELSFDRFKHARDELLHALELLDQMIEWNQLLNLITWIELSVSPL